MKSFRLELDGPVSRSHFAVALALVSVIPLLAFLYLFLPASGAWHARPGGPWVLGIGVLYSLGIGWFLLSRYPAVIVKLRNILRMQNADLMIAERQRVMIESLGAACHHLGQPATVITTCLDLLMKTNPTPEQRRLLEECSVAAEKTADILNRLRSAGEYRSVPYLLHETSGMILDLGEKDMQEQETHGNKGGNHDVTARAQA